MRNTSLNNFEMFKYDTYALLREDFSLNDNFGIYIEDSLLKASSVLKASKTNLKYLSSIFVSELFFEYLDLSDNDMKIFTSGNPQYFVHLNLRNNKIETINTVFNSVLRPLTGIELESEFKNNFASLKYLDLTNSFSFFSRQIFQFNKVLEVARLSDNGFYAFPKFCQLCLLKFCLENLDISIDCQLKELHFDSNRLEKLSYSDLAELDNFSI